MIAAPHVLLGLLAGVTLALSHPPVGWPLLALLVPALFVAGLDLATPAGRRWWPVPVTAAVVGYGAMLSWVVQPAGYVGWTLLVLVHVAWWTLLAAVVVGTPRSAWRPLVVAVAWVGIDALRGTVPLNGFPWGTLGAATVDLPWLATLARVAGEKAITLAVVVLSVAAWEAIRGPLDASRDGTGRLRWDRVGTTLRAGSVGAAWLGGTALVVTLAVVEPPSPDGQADVLVVQPNEFAAFAGTGADLDAAIAANAVELTATSVHAAGAPDLTIWPESTIDDDPGRNPAMADALVQGGALTEGRLLAGAILDGRVPRTFRNVVLAVGADGQVVDSYQKRRLVPFGEYVPYRDALDWFEPLEQVPRDAVPGPGPQLLHVGDLRVAVVICFETLFGELTRSNLLAAEDPGHLVVAATNDASFGRGGEAAQHLAQSQLRALETGRWVVHGAVSGTSAFVDPSGRVHDATELFEATSIRRTLTTTTGRTPFLVTGDWLGPATITGLVVLAVLAVRRHRRARTLPGATDG